MKKARKDFQRLAELRAKEAAQLAKSGYQQKSDRDIGARVLEVLSRAKIP